MSTDSQSSRRPFADVGARPAAALRNSLREGYGWPKLRADLMAGLVVGIVALPLSMALAIATGVPPQHGLYTAIVAGVLIALLGGSRVQVSGPTAAFVVILAPIAAKYGLGGLATASVMAGVLLIAFGWFRLGRLIEFVPYPVTTGFTAGIALVIAMLQVKDFLGLPIPEMPEYFVGKVMSIVQAIPSLSWPDFLIGLATLVALLLWPRVTQKIPAALIVLPLAAAIAWLLPQLLADVSIATINSRFTFTDGTGAVQHGIPRAAPSPLLPWNLPGPGGEHLALDWDTFKALTIAAFAIAMLGAIESLLSAVVADGMGGTRHDPDSELLAQGVGNIVAPFFGGFAATGALARTATNARAGARSPVASIVHAIFVLLSVLLFAPLLGFLPMASLAALLLVVAMNMAEFKHFAYVLRVGPRSDALVLIVCFLLTVIFDMVIAVSVGVVLAALLFMRRMAEVGGVQLVGESHPDLGEPLPHGVLYYRIAGPLFFGAAQKAMSSLHATAPGASIVILDLEDVPVIDATGLVNLTSALARLHAQSVRTILSCAQPQPLAVLGRAGLTTRSDDRVTTTSREEALATARQWSAMNADSARGSSVVAHLND